MNNPTMDDMNEAIALFMGWELVDREGVSCLVRNDYRRYHYELQYHSSWDWLIPVYLKAKGIANKILSNESDEIISKAAGMITWTSELGDILWAMHLAYRDSEIEKLHLALYDFIIWYNKNKQS